MAKRGRRKTLIQESRGISPQQKAIYHAESGAGRKRVIRDFFNVGPGDTEAITRMLQARITTRLGKRG